MTFKHQRLQYGTATEWWFELQSAADSGASITTLLHEAAAMKVARRPQQRGRWSSNHDTDGTWCGCCAVQPLVTTSQYFHQLETININNCRDILVKQLVRTSR